MLTDVLGRRVLEVMSRTAVCVEPDPAAPRVAISPRASVFRALSLMAQRGVNLLVVAETDRVVGLVTLSSLRRAIREDGDEPHAHEVSEPSSASRAA